MGKKKRLSSWDKKYIKLEDGDLGRGGNANVFRVKKGENEIYALKELRECSPEKKGRFREEIKIMSENKDIIGIIPIIEYNLEECWYVMPVAEPIMEHLARYEQRLDEVKNTMIQLTDTMKLLHMKHIAHRDIKPDNLYYYNGHYCFGDFGLVDFPDHVSGLTKTDRGVGATFTISPEMKRDPKSSDGLKADIYSLAKTFWMLLVGDGFGFEGVYNCQDESHGLRYREEYRDAHLAELEQLLSKATSNAPEDRPTIEQFQTAIQYWLEVSEDKDKSQKSDWNYISSLIFGKIYQNQQFGTTWSQ